MGFKSPVGIPEHENETTTRGQAREGDRPREGRLWEIRELMDKNRIEPTEGRQPAAGCPQGERSEATPTRSAEVAQHTEGGWYARGGKSGGSAKEQRAITWGDLTASRR